MKASITDTLLKEKNRPSGPVDIYDTQQPGFLVRVFKSGKASYRVNYGRGKSLTIGRYPDLTPAEARAQAKRIIGEAAKGNDPGAARRKAKAATLREFIDNVYAPWLEVHRKSGAATAQRLRACFNSELGARRLPELSPWQLEKWKTARIKAGRSPSTVHRDLGALKTALNRAADWGYVDVNPIAKAKPPENKDDNVTPRFLSEKEDKRLRAALDARQTRQREERRNANHWRQQRGYPLLPDLDALPHTDRLKPLVLLALNTGCRRGELFNLQWGDVDLTGGMLTVHGGGAKSGKTRHVPLNDEARQLLADWRVSTGATSGYVFPAEDGGRLNNVNKSWRALVAAAEIKGFRFHDLRHTFASWLVMRGVDLNTVRDLLGHADLKMTLRYAHLAPEHKAQAVQALTRGTV